MAPYWVDHCEHEEGSYVASFIYRERSTTGEHVSKVDIYIFSNRYYGHEVCLRYGPCGPDYLSPTGLTAFIRSATHDSAGLYAKALDILMQHGKIKWERNENP